MYLKPEDFELYSNEIYFNVKIFGLRLHRTGFYNGYNETTDGTVPSAFAAAAFRFGHSLVQPQLHRCDEQHREMPYSTCLILSSLRSV